MQSYSTELIIKASRSKVFSALTTEEGLRSWWTNTCKVDSTVGKESRFEFVFDDGITYNVMLNEIVNPNEKLVWKCIEQYHPTKPDGKKFKNPNEWVDSRIIFILSEESGNTKLNFTHEGLTPKLECYDVCNDGWNHFLHDSLKPYLEEGLGNPYEYNRKS